MGHGVLRSVTSIDLDESQHWLAYWGRSRGIVVALHEGGRLSLPSLALVGCCGRTCSSSRLEKLETVAVSAV